MKKIFAVCLSVLLCAGVAFAQPPMDPNAQSVSGVYSIGIAAQDGSYSQSIHGWGNDYAGASAVGSTSAETITFGNGNKMAFETGFAAGNVAADANSFAKDFGTTSIAGASASTEGASVTGGLVIAPNKITLEWNRCRPTLNEGPTNDGVISGAFVGGEVGQFNVAQEVGYANGTGAVAQNSSGGTFVAGNFDADFGKHGAVAGTDIGGGIETSGFSKVSVDPTGANRSATGMTTNSVNVEVCKPDFYAGSVGGQGSVQTVAGSPAGSAGAMSAFGYSGAKEGYGVAQNYSAIQTGAHSTSAQAVGFSMSTAK